MAKALYLAVRVLIAIVVGVYLIRFAGFSILLPAAGVLYGLVLFLLFGIPMLRRVGKDASGLYCPDDSHFRIVPEYSIPEARIQEGRYQEGIDEYRKVIAEHPEDVYPHLRIADVAANHLSDLKLAEIELLSACAKAAGPDTTALAAGRLADLYQHTLHDPARALEVMEQLRTKLPGARAAIHAEERIRTLRELIAGREPPKTPTKISYRSTDEETLRRRRGF